MAFRVWFYFMLLTGITLLSLWMLQISFIQPYYERSRDQVINQKALEVEKLVQTEEGISEPAELSNLLVTENMCGSIYNTNGELVLSSGGNLACLLEDLPTKSIIEYILMAQEAPTSQFSIKFSSDIFDQGMYFYGKEIMIEEENHYIFINSPLELLDSTIFVIRRQFALLATVVFSMATMVSIFLSRHLARPIERLNDSAHFLADGDFDVKFDGEGYDEMESLASTLNYATEEFKKTNDLRRDLIANVSHDYKTPLTMIRAYAEMIQDISGENPLKRNEHLDVILQEVDHLELLVNDMLTLSKYESKMYAIQRTAFNLEEHISSTVNLFNLEDWDIVITAPENLTVYADEVKMGQVLYNFLSNAIKYASQHKRIDIMVEDYDKEHVQINVKDYGPGLDAEESAQIWDRYYKIDKNFERQHAQSGLGLSIVKAICEANDSKFGLTSKKGEGATFNYTLEKYKAKKL